MMSVEYQGQTDLAVLDELQHCFYLNPIGIFMIGVDGRLRQINQRASRIFGFASPEEALGKSLSQLEFFFSPPIVARINQLMSDGESFKISCFPGTNLSGHFAHYCLACNRSEGRDGLPGGVIGIIEDVSEQVKRQQEFKDRVEELSILS
jgi:PAS domain S-box-containing protein